MKNNVSGLSNVSVASICISWALILNDSTQRKDRALPDAVVNGLVLALFNNGTGLLVSVATSIDILLDLIKDCVDLIEIPSQTIQRVLLYQRLVVNLLLDVQDWFNLDDVTTIEMEGMDQCQGLKA